MKRLVLVPAALVVFALCSQADLKVRLYVPVYAQDAVAASRAQDAPASPAPDRGAGPSGPAFEVASVRQNKSGDRGGMFRNQPGGRFNVTNVPLKQIVQLAYAVQPFQLTGGPDWLESDRWDIVAKAEDGNVAPLGPPGTGPSPLALMLQSLLADRFKLKVHRETREMPIYALVLARSDGKLGSKIERSTEDCGARGRGAGRPGGPPPAGPPAPPKPGERPPCGMFMGPGSVGAGSVTMRQLADMLSARVGRTVLDKTGLTGSWSFDFEFAPEFIGPPPPGAQLPPVDPNAPSIYTALQEQLGLKLDAQKGPVEMLVIDSVERPTED
jgi:uncharacterized protein (TIGR03435 family)